MASTGTLGRVDEFDSSKDVWPEYVEHLEHFFAANGITDGDKQCGPTTVSRNSQL